MQSRERVKKGGESTVWREKRGRDDKLGTRNKGMGGFNQNTLYTCINMKSSFFVLFHFSI